MFGTSGTWLIPVHTITKSNVCSLTAWSVKERQRTVHPPVDSWSAERITTVTSVWKRILSTRWNRSAYISKYSRNSSWGRKFGNSFGIGKSLKQRRCLLMFVTVDCEIHDLVGSSVYRQIPPIPASLSKAVGWRPSSNAHFIAARPAAPAPITATVAAMFESATEIRSRHKLFIATEATTLANVGGVMNGCCFATWPNCGPVIWLIANHWYRNLIELMQVTCDSWIARNAHET